MQIPDFLDQSSFNLSLSGQTKQRVLEELVATVATDHPELDAPALLTALWQRERLSSTAIAQGIAVPHAKAFVPLGPIGSYVMILAIIWGVAGLNILGIRENARVFAIEHRGAATAQVETAVVRQSAI